MKKKWRKLLIRRIDYIDPSLIEQLEECSDKPPSKLIEHCISLNNSYKKKNYMTMAIIIRGILDYIPTIFGFTHTAQVYSELSGRKTFKDALHQLDQAIRNLADDVLHSPARKGETLKVSKLNIDNLQNNFVIVLSEATEQLRTNDLRVEGNERLREQRTVKPKRQSSQLETFENYIMNENWSEQYFDGHKVWICEIDNLYQIHERDDYEEFSEPWTQVYPDKNGSGKHSVDLVYSGAVIKQFTFVYCDGGRISVVLPEVYVAPEHRHKHDDNDYREFYWHKNSLGYKLMNLIGSFYSYKTPERVASMSNIKIEEVK